MKWLKNLFKKKPDGKIIVIGELESLLVHPFGILQPLGAYIAYKTGKIFIGSSNDLMLFSLSNDNSFIGTFVCIKYGDNYYGNIFGDDRIIYCNPKNFNFQKTDTIIYPFGDGHELSAKFKNGKLTPLDFCKRTNDKQKTIYHFREDNSINQAFEYCLAYIGE